MPAPINDKIKLKDIIFMYSEASKQNEGEFLRFWRIAFRAFIQMGLNAFWEPITTQLVVGANKTALLPVDLIQWIKIGYFNYGGELATLRVNNDLTTYKDNSANRLTDITPEVQQILTSDCWFDINQFTGVQGFGWSGLSGYAQRFGAGSHLVQPGECRVDMANRVIVLNPNFQYPNIIIEYLSSPEQNDDYAIPLQFQEAMIAWLGYQDIAYMPATGHVGNANIQMRANMFKSQLSLAKRMYKPFRLQDAYQQAVEAQSLGLKP